VCCSAQGSLPSNVGGASNVRNILRRTFALLHDKGWWSKLGMDGFMELFLHHKADLATIYGQFKDFAVRPSHTLTLLHPARTPASSNSHTHAQIYSAFFFLILSIARRIKMD
jgi:hypothetical protein